jgi:hypothetical protein
LPHLAGLSCSTRNLERTLAGLPKKRKIADHRVQSMPWSACLHCRNERFAGVAAGNQSVGLQVRLHFLLSNDGGVALGKSDAMRRVASKCLICWSTNTNRALFRSDLAMSTRPIKGEAGKLATKNHLPMLAGKVRCLQYSRRHSRRHAGLSAALAFVRSERLSGNFRPRSLPGHFPAWHTTNTYVVCVYFSEGFVAGYFVQPAKHG